MPMIQFHETRPTAAEVRAGAAVTYRFTPTRARLIEGSTPVEEVLPLPFTRSTVNGLLEVHLDPTGATWAWAVERLAPGLDVTLEYVSVPEVAGPLSFHDLLRVDPATLMPDDSTVPAWEAASAAVAASVAAAGASATAAHADMLAAVASADSAALSASEAGAFATHASAALVAASGHASDAAAASGSATASAADAAGHAAAAAESAADAAEHAATALDHTHPVDDIDATGTLSDQTFLRGDGVWAEVESGGGVALPSPVTPILDPLVVNVNAGHPLAGWAGTGWAWVHIVPITVTLTREVAFICPPIVGPAAAKEALELYVMTEDLSNSLQSIGSGSPPASLSLPPASYNLVAIHWSVPYIDVGPNSVDVSMMYEMKRALESPDPGYVLALGPDGETLTPVLGQAGLRVNLAVGDEAEATAPGSLAVGIRARATGTGSLAHGRLSVASGVNAQAGGNGSNASGDSSHAEGRSSTASGPQSHAEGSSTVASGEASHAEGHSTVASGSYAHAGGRSARAFRVSELAQGNFRSQISLIPLPQQSAGTSRSHPLDLPASSLSLLDIEVTAYSGTFATCAAWRIRALAACPNATSTRLVGTPVVEQVFADAGATGWTVALTASGTANQVTIACSSSASANWTVTAHIAERRASL